MQLRPAVIRTTALLFMGLFAPLGIAACAGGEEHKAPIRRRLAILHKGHGLLRRRW